MTALNRPSPETLAEYRARIAAGRFLDHGGPPAKGTEDPGYRSTLFYARDRQDARDNTGFDSRGNGDSDFGARGQNRLARDPAGRILIDPATWKPYLRPGVPAGGRWSMYLFHWGIRAADAIERHGYAWGTDGWSLHIQLRLEALARLEGTDWTPRDSTRRWAEWARSFGAENEVPRQQGSTVSVGLVPGLDTAGDADEPIPGVTLAAWLTDQPSAGRTRGTSSGKRGKVLRPAPPPGTRVGPDAVTAAGLLNAAMRLAARHVQRAETAPTLDRRTIVAPSHVGRLAERASYPRDPAVEREMRTILLLRETQRTLSRYLTWSEITKGPSTPGTWHERVRGSVPMLERRRLLRLWVEHGADELSNRALGLMLGVSPSTVSKTKRKWTPRQASAIPHAIEESVTSADVIRVEFSNRSEQRAYEDGARHLPPLFLPGSRNI